ncbi:hypothetical protein E5676_scaffold1032G00150 [Cucumis melo var. makuwa]|uniref:Protein MNN4-like n=2 Tax=Cucumis melo TaxID=3656 RepID=A0A5A7SUZ4_CUCMM|nr:hypothetical protein E6C27_scaffold269G002910 [Cucumis melo var. makuwa]TYK17087.1 hypothetical protein E5676_scaffold1032G00150 [Cucumis melo var. makuwa]
MFGKQALKKYQGTVGKASLSNEGAEKTPSDGLVSEQRKEKRPLKMVIINGVEIQLTEDKLGDLLAIIFGETSKREDEQKVQERLEKEKVEKEEAEKEQREREREEREKKGREERVEKKKEKEKKEKKEMEERERMEKEKEVKKKEEEEKKKKEDDKKKKKKMRQEGKKRKCTRRHKKKLCKKKAPHRLSCMALRPWREKKETKLREREELLGKVDNVALSAEKDKCEEKNFEVHYEEFEKEIDKLCPLEEKVIRPAKKRTFTMKKKALRKQFAKRRVEEMKRKPKKD